MVGLFQHYWLRIAWIGAPIAVQIPSLVFEKCVLPPRKYKNQVTCCGEGFSQTYAPSFCPDEIIFVQDKTIFVPDKIIFVLG